MTKRGNQCHDADSGNAKRKRHLLFWVLAAVILVALCSIFAASITLKWSSTNNLDFDSTILEDLDEVEEREKVVREMWDVYSRSHANAVGLPKFWEEAFEAAYEELVSDVGGVRDGAVSEIAKMSLRSLPRQFNPVSSNSNQHFVLTNSVHTYILLLLLPFVIYAGIGTTLNPRGEVDEKALH
ncbi:unnamed protein product [Sphenostylis stenocarpa]|uniref:Uncharacterized protein n=1 Tax=Sphenostylis stenocarpa TaxID=92480 RepID=A0AA86SV05_9FABA|nr:unnamed protein product [Sphenostylis stenocarpa]